VRGCGQELDLHGHHSAACHTHGSASVGGERTHHHNEVIDYVAGQLKRAGFPCTSKDSDIPQHPSAQIDRAQHEHVDLHIPGFAGSVLGHRTFIDVVRAHPYNKHGTVLATRSEP
jgi:hypothetical protein